MLTNVNIYKYHWLQPLKNSVNSGLVLRNLATHTAKGFLCNSQI